MVVLSDGQWFSPYQVTGVPEHYGAGEMSSLWEFLKNLKSYVIVMMPVARAALDQGMPPSRQSRAIWSKTTGLLPAVVAKRSTEK